MLITSISDKMFYRIGLLPFLGRMLALGVGFGLAFGSAAVIYRGLTDGRRQEKKPQYVNSMNPEYMS